jgi:hypothetical protein
MTMVVGFRKAVFWACFALAAGAAPAFAQENLDAGKSAAQLFNSDCAICHKSPQGLAKGGGMFGLSGFLREHYTASRETAALLAAYLKQVDAAPAGKPAPTRRAKASKPKSDEKKSDEDKKKAEEAKSAKPASDKKPDEPKAAAGTAPKDEKPAVAAQPAESKPAEKPAEPKPDTGHGANAKSGGDKPDSAKTSADKSADVKSEKKD